MAFALADGGAGHGAQNVGDRAQRLIVDLGFGDDAERLGMSISLVGVRVALEVVSIA
jgi:hypothetical protein